MCAKCAELDQKIDYCRHFAARCDDQLTQEGVAMLIDSYSSEKNALHTSPESGRDGNPTKR